MEDNHPPPDLSAFKQRAMEELEEIARTEMPFGRYSGRKLYQLPAEYLQWFVAHGWPKGKLGVLMQKVYQMKADGSDIAFDLFRPTKRRKADM